MRRSWTTAVAALMLLFGSVVSSAETGTQAYTLRTTTLEILVEGKPIQLPAALKTRRQVEGAYNTDFVLDADLRQLFARLPGLITGVKRNGGQTVTLSNVSCRYANGRIHIRSTADYRQALTGGLDLAQTVHSTVALFPAFDKGVLRMDYEVREAAFEGLAQGLLAVTGTDPRTVVKMIFDLYFKEDLTYPLPPAYRKVPVNKKELRLYAREGKFFGLRAGGSARLSDAEYEDLLKRHF